MGAPSLQLHPAFLMSSAQQACSKLQFLTTIAPSVAQEVSAPRLALFSAHNAFLVLLPRILEVFCANFVVLARSAYLPILDLSVVRTAPWADFLKLRVKTAALHVDQVRFSLKYKKRAVGTVKWANSTARVNRLRAKTVLLGFSPLLRELWFVKDVEQALSVPRKARRHARSALPAQRSRRPISWLASHVN